MNSIRIIQAFQDDPVGPDKPGHGEDRELMAVLPHWSEVCRSITPTRAWQQLSRFEAGIAASWPETSRALFTMWQ